MPVERIIVLNTLRYQEEIQPHPDVAAAVARKTAGASGRELDMALKLVDEMSTKWDPAAFSDTYRKDLMKRIEEKLEAGQTHALTQPEAGSSDTRGARGGKVVDLMSLLERSLEQRGRAGSAGDGSARGSKRKHSAARRRSLHPRQARRA
jgi:DNA end-binding protein Ku